MAKRTPIPPPQRGIPQRGNKYKQPQPEGPTWRPEFTGTLLFILAGITLLFLFTPNRSEVAAFYLPYLFVVMGWGQYVFPFVLIFLAVWFFKFYSSENRDAKLEKPIGAFLFMGILLIALHFALPGEGMEAPGGGGVIGWVL